MSIQIFVKTLTGKNIALDVESTSTVLDIKREFFERENIPLEQQLFVFNGTYLEDDITLDDYGINDDSSLNIVFRISLYYILRQDKIKKHSFLILSSRRIRGGKRRKSKAKKSKKSK